MIVGAAGATMTNQPASWTPSVARKLIVCTGKSLGAAGEERWKKLASKLTARTAGRAAHTSTSAASKIHSPRVRMGIRVCLRSRDDFPLFDVEPFPLWKGLSLVRFIVFSFPFLRWPVHTRSNPPGARVSSGPSLKPRRTQDFSRMRIGLSHVRFLLQAVGGAQGGIATTIDDSLRIQDSMEKGARSRGRSARCGIIESS